MQTKPTYDVTPIFYESSEVSRREEEVRKFVKMVKIGDIYTLIDEIYTFF